MNKTLFAGRFEELTGNRPLSWQTRLYDEYFFNAIFPPVIDVPTGLGKTMVIAIWLITRAELGSKIPTRLIYVVDRRTVVDQATDLAQMFIQRPITKWIEDAFKGKPPAISTLRGQLADNREWSTDPSRPAIIIGTVDLIGSALLFSGYRSSYKRRPLEAGLLGQDSLLVLDEAHLSKPFEQLLAGRKLDDGTRENGIEQFQRNKGKPMRVIRMSATSDSSTDSMPSFTLLFDANGNLTSEDAKDETIVERFDAKKRLTIRTLGEKDKLTDTFASEAIKLAENSSLRGKRIVVFVRNPDHAIFIAAKIRNHGEPSKSKSSPDPKGPYAEAVEVLTGTMRGLERDKLVEKPVLKRFLDGNENPDLAENKKPVFLVSTSAGEVGFDLNADHLIGDEAPLDSWIQRLGRVNRRGKSTAIAQVLVESSSGKKIREGEANKHTIDSASASAMEALKQLPKVEAIDFDERPDPIFDASSRELRKLSKPEPALSPKPTMVELTDILLDAWSMTSITKPMPGRPEVGPWLRGIEDTQAQTTIAWRAELDLLDGEADPSEAFKTIFATHRVRPHESLTVNTSSVIEFFNKITKERGGYPQLRKKYVVVQLVRGLYVRTIGQLMDDDRILYQQPTIILPASFGGLDNGMLSPERVARPGTTDTPPIWLDIADEPGYEPRDDREGRRRMVLQRDGKGWKYFPYSLERSDLPRLEAIFGEEDEVLSRPDISKRLRNGCKFRTIGVVKFDVDEEGDPRKLLLLLTGISPQATREKQSLAEHIEAVHCEAERIARDLGISADNPIHQALTFAAAWHDCGKDTPTWQRFVGGPEADGSPRGKSDKYCDPKRLGGYRHEFGSLLRVQFPDPKPNEYVRELALHMIAVHHGFGRPHFDSPIDRDFHDPGRIYVAHADCLRWFARLQRKYGWWYLTWLENLLRCADQIASAQVGNEDIQEDEMEAANEQSQTQF
jgi:CRISPR-associated endonuclease/helicase Cas3